MFDIGKDIINNKEELSYIIEELYRLQEQGNQQQEQQQEQQKEVETRKSRADSIVSNSQKISNLVFLRDSTVKGFNYDFITDSYINSGFVLNKKKGNILNANDYRILFVTTDGYIMTYVSAGSNEGYWKIDPFDITVK